MELIEIMPDKEKARSLLNLAKLRFTKISLFYIETDAPLIIESYYEIAKEIITAILFCDGFKTLNHTNLIKYMKENYMEFLGEENIDLLDKLRIYRNKINYEGIFISNSYLRRNKERIEHLLKILFEIIENKKPN